MSLYFFDFRSHVDFLQDNEGTELPNDAEARFEAVETLLQLARGKFIGKEEVRWVAVSVRNDLGANVYKGELRLKENWSSPIH